MNTVTWIFGIVTIVAFLFAVVWAIYQTRLGKKQRKIALKFAKNECYSLFRGDINSLNINIQYQSKPIKNQIILFKGEIQNSGNLDIDKQSIYQPIKLISSTDFNWLEINITNKPEGARVRMDQTDGNILELNWDLLKKGEKISFEALIEVKNFEEKKNVSKEFFDSLHFDFRITNLTQIEKEDIPIYIMTPPFTMGALTIIVLFLLSILLFTGSFLDYKYSKFVGMNSVIYNIKLDSIAVKGKVMSPSFGQYIKISDKEGEKIFEGTTDEFNSEIEILGLDEITITKTDRKTMRFISGTFILFAFILIYSLAQKHMLRRSYRALFTNIGSFFSMFSLLYGLEPVMRIKKPKSKD